MRKPRASYIFSHIDGLDVFREPLFQLWLSKHVPSIAKTFSYLDGVDVSKALFQF